MAKESLLKFAAAFLVAQGVMLACTCSEVEPFCNSLPRQSDTRTAIFVGTVTEVYPADSIREYRDALLAEASPSATGIEAREGPVSKVSAYMTCDTATLPNCCMRACIQKS